MHCTENFDRINYGLRNRLHAQPVTQKKSFRLNRVIISGTTVSTLVPGQGDGNPSISKNDSRKNPRELCVVWQIPCVS